MERLGLTVALTGVSLLLLLLQARESSAEFKCPWNATNCSCMRGIRGDWELLCPKDLPPQVQPALIGTFLPGRYIQLQCTNMNDWENLSLVSGLEVGRVESFSLRLCPLPGISFKELMASMGIPSTGWLQVQSHGNMSNTLTQRHLEGLSELTQLHLNMNALTELPEDLFRDLGNLTWLDLKNNNVFLPRGIFRYVPKLEVLELGGNNISYLEAGIFRNLTKLRLLNLWGNRLQNLTRAVFSDVPNVESLDLNNNGLVTLPPDVFADLAKLKKINLYANNFFSLPQSLFRNNPILETVQIHSNRRALKTLPPAFFKDLKQMKELSLKSCNISYLPEDLLVGCTNLENLTLEQNLLTDLPQGIFQDVKEVTKLTLSRNKLTQLPGLIFATMYKLKILDLSHNELSNISKDVFSNLRDLETLKLSYNKIKSIHSHAFEVTISLRTLDLSYNLLENMKKTYKSSFGDDSVLQSAVNLESLYLAHNQLSSVYGDWRISMTNLQVLDLSHNNFTNITIYDLQFTSTSLTIDLTANNISLIGMDDAEKIAREKFEEAGRLPLENTSVKVILKGNPLACDCKAFSLARYFRDESEPLIKLIAELDGADLRCATAPDPQLKGVLIQDVNPKLLVCEVKEDECPSQCSCYYRPADSALAVDCSSRGLTSLPDRLPARGPSAGHTNHTVLDLSGNRLRSVSGHLAEGYSRVTGLYLAGNNITALNLTGFSKQLEIIELNNNNLTRLDTGTLKMLEESKTLVSITLEKNPWICDCQTKEFLTFLQANFRKVPRINNVTCSNGHPLSKMTASELCPFTNIVIGVISMVVALLGLVIGGLIALYYRYQREVKVWLYSHRWCLWLVTEEELDKDKQYDAFVSYSHQDEELITKHLQPNLENGNPKYKLCLHYRDWVVGDFIPDQIARSVEASRRTIVILSPNFLESVWGRMEFRTAHSQALSEGRARVIVILYGDIGPTENLDPELRAYLSTNTYVKWGDPWFWEKLRYALPHPPQLSKGGGLPQLTRNMTQSNGTPEKLINGHANSNPATTPPADTFIIEPLKTLSNSKPV